MKTLIKIALIAIIAVVTYNYFMGNDKEKEQAERVVDKVKDLGAEIGRLIKNERQSYDEGKYDDAFDKLGDLIGTVKEKVSQIDLKEKLSQIDDKKKELEEKVKELDNESGDKKDELSGKINDELSKIFEDLEKVVEEIKDNN